jgi:hypothetical protein
VTFKLIPSDKSRNRNLNRKTFGNKEFYAVRTNLQCAAPGMLARASTAFPVTANSGG